MRFIDSGDGRRSRSGVCSLFERRDAQQRAIGNCGSQNGNEAPDAGSNCTCESAGIAIREHLLPIGDQRHT